MNYDMFYGSSIGSLYLLEQEGFLVGIALEKPEILEGAPKKTPLLEEVKKQLSEYFAGTRKKFQLPLKPEGTPFQKKVWEALENIPYGQTNSYQQIAQKIGNPKAARAVGMANNRNPIMIVIPCHRVIGSNGELVGYAGGLEKKEMLLRGEGALTGVNQLTKRFEKERKM